MKTASFDVDQATRLIDDLVQKYLHLTHIGLSFTLKQFDTIFSRSTPRLINHLKDQWRSKQEFAQFYLNLDGSHRRMLLEYWKVPVDPEKYPDYEDRMLAVLRGEDKFDVYPFQTQMLHQFLLLAHNRSLEEVKKLEHGDLLYRHLLNSGVDAFGNGTNWGGYYAYLWGHNVAERKGIIQYAYSFH